MGELVSDLEKRVLVVPPTRRDGEITQGLLSRAGMSLVLCSGLAQLATEIVAGAGVLLLTDEALRTAGVEQFLGALEKQPPWSDLPVVLLIPGAGQAIADGVMRRLSNVTVLEKPVPVRSLVSALQSAIRGRSRQYQIRDQLRALREAESREREARAESERAGRMKDDFLATLSHELRTPLNAILGWSQILTTGERDEADLKEGLQSIQRNARAQTQIIEDLLDMSRIISGKVRLDVQPTDVGSVVKAAVETSKPAADAKGVRIQTVLDPIAGSVSGDPNRLQQVFWNLLINAVKFTPKGGRIQVLLERVNSHLEVSVIDTGEGISPDFLPHVFDRFRQSDASTTRRHGGLGLGLAIVKQLVELHGGNVRAKSPGPGKGSTFTVSLPLMPIHENAEPGPERRHPRAASASGYAEPCASIAGFRVLVVDDEPDARALMKRLLEECKATVWLAANAEEAVAVLKAERPDVLVSDIGMPNEDGYALMRRIRELPAEQGGRTPAVALTAYARTEDRMKAILAGFQHHVAKPVEPAELITMVASLVQRQDG